MLFYNEDNKRALYFDGFDFIYKDLFVFSSIEFKEIDYSKRNKKVFFEIEDIRESDLGGIYYIKLKSGEIFQIYFMVNEDIQRVDIFYESLGQIYKEAINRFNIAEECDIFYKSPRTEN